MWEFQCQGKTYNIQNKIGQGYTAEVYKATNSKKQTLCVKIINQQFYKQPISKELIDNEVEVLSKLSHSNILRFVKKEQKKKLMIITEFCAGGTLYEMLTKKRKFNQIQSISIIKQIINGCIYLHSQGYIHRDLKPQNIFFTQKDKPQVKIADFGFAVSLKNFKLLSTNVGSPLYMPFQALSQMKFSKQSDIFAIGVMWYELLTGKTPFQARTQGELKQVVKLQKIRDATFQCDSKIKQMILRCLRKNISERPSLQELLNAMETINVQVQRKTFKSFLDTTGFSISKQLNKQYKENLNPFTSEVLKRVTRSKTNVQSVALKSSKKTTIDLSKVHNAQKMALKPTKKTTIDLSNVPSQIKIQAKKVKSNSTFQFTSHLSKLIQCKLSFLPKSIEHKYIYILKRYQSLLTGQETLLKAGQQNKQDELLKSLNHCQTEKQFCVTASNFLRRLLRLARTYKQFGTCVKDLSILWNRMESIIV